ncbi:hypothetical protein SERLA73DRAFT_126642 [Serpula lacrymans var. lacrymans S7.3]|uniref:Uncharacterized protein n=1 Tax=Serpula lacrymans var. lacrymans (strain S7.3) TaxID=936435 RepID=F8QE13_SERL3|nr:hypothetical protein SERLA73DRAFT_126642 [Serpula lacrymans var. lacrymans S7.3]
MMVFFPKQADKISTDPTTHGSLFVPVILGSNKTTVSVATGQNKYYSLYISVGNVHNNVQQAHRNAVVLLGFLAIPKIPEIVRCANMHLRHVIYGIGPYIADYPEQALLACIVQGWCARCIALPNNLDGEGGQHYDHTEVLADFLDLHVLRDQYGIVSNIVPFTHDFPCADIHEILAPDLLHQVIKGTFKDHLVTWVEDYLNLIYGKKHAEEISDDIDRWIAAAPSFSGLQQFPQGRGFKQWTGDDSKALMKVYLPAIEGYVPPDIICTFRAFLDFFYLVQHDTYSDSSIQQVQDTGKDFHRTRVIFQTLGHYPLLICMFGSPNGLCSSITESRQITAVKEPWHRSSRYEALGQMLLVNQQLDKLAASCVDFTMRGMLTVRQYSTKCYELSLQLNQPRLVELIRWFLYSQARINDCDAPSAFDIPLHQCPTFNSRVVATHSAIAYFMHQRDPSITGIRGLDVVQIFAFLSFSHNNTTYPCALIQWFFHILDEPDELTGMWKVQPDTNNNASPSLEIIHLDCIFCSAHLMPVFSEYGHCFIPSDIDFTNSLDRFSTFYINKYIDRHAFGLGQLDM